MPVAKARPKAVTFGRITIGLNPSDAPILCRRDGTLVSLHTAQCVPEYAPVGGLPLYGHLDQLYFALHLHLPLQLERQPASRQSWRDPRPCPAHSRSSPVYANRKPLCLPPVP